MSEGEIYPYTTYYPNWNYVQGEYKHNTHSGVKFMFFAIIITIIEIILSMISYPINLTMIYERGYDEGTWVVIMIISGFSFLLFLVFIILAFISLYFFYHGRFEFDKQHTEDIKWVMIFLVCYIILFIISFLFLSLISIFLNVSNFYIYNSILQAISILQTFFIAFLILFLIRSFAGNREKDILYAVASLLILISILSNIFELAFLWAFQDLGFFGSIIYYELIILLSLSLWSLAAYAYYNIACCTNAK